MRGRSEAQRLARCRAQMQHRRRDGRRVNAIPSVITVTAANRHRMHRAWGHHFQDSNSPASARERASFAGNSFRTNGNRVVRKIWVAIERVRCRKHAPLLAAEHAVSDNLKRQRQPWRERPLRTGAGPHRARAAGSLTPWFPIPTATAAPTVGGKERRPFAERSRAPVRTSCAGIGYNVPRKHWR